MKKEAKKYVDGYKAFLTEAKTERRAYAAAVRLLEKAGFRELKGAKRLKAGDKVWRGYHGKTLFAAVVGRAGTSAGVRVVGGHTDAPRLDLKPKPLYEKGDITFFSSCSLPKWGRMSEIMNAGSPGASPIATSTRVPSFFATVP